MVGSSFSCLTFLDLYNTHLKRSFRRKKEFYFSPKSTVFKNSAFVYGVMFLYSVAKPYRAVDPRQSLLTEWPCLFFQVVVVICSHRHLVNTNFFFCTYHKNSLQLFDKGNLHTRKIFGPLPWCLWRYRRILFTYSRFVSFVRWYLFLYHWRSSLFITLEILENEISLLGGLLTVLLLLILKDGGIGGRRGREEIALLSI